MKYDAFVECVTHCVSSIHLRFPLIFFQIGADGANSIVRKHMDVTNFSLSYRQMGIVANLELNEEEAAGNTVAWQRFLPSGPIALLPLTDNLSSLVWTTDYNHAKQLLRMSAGEFVDALNHALVRPVFASFQFKLITFFYEF